MTARASRSPCTGDENAAHAVQYSALWLCAGALVAAYLLGRTLPFLSDDAHLAVR